MVFGQGRPGFGRDSQGVHENATTVNSMLIWHNFNRRQKGLYSSMSGLSCRASPPYLSLSRAKEFVVAALSGISINSSRVLGMKSSRKNEADCRSFFKEGNIRPGGFQAAGSNQQT